MKETGRVSGLNNRGTDSTGGGKLRKKRFRGSELHNMKLNADLKEAMACSAKKFWNNALRMI